MTMRSPRLSIIVPNYNYGRFFARLGTSLANQVLGLDIFELILVDDGSTDDSLQQAGELGNLPFARVEVVELEHTGKPGPVRNAGLKLARGQYLTCLDPDDLPAPEWLASCLCELDGHPEKHLAYTDYTHVEAGNCREVRLPEFNPALLANQNILPPAAVFRREVWEASDGFRANTTYEDWDFWIQAADNGFAGSHLDRLLFAHMVHGDNFSFAACRDDAKAKAAIVLNNPGFFPAGVRHWANGVVQGEPWAHAFPRGIIPLLEDVEKLLSLAGEIANNHR